MVISAVIDDTHGGIWWSIVIYGDSMATYGGYGGLQWSVEIFGMWTSFCDADRYFEYDELSKS